MRALGTTAGLIACAATLAACGASQESGTAPAASAPVQAPDEQAALAALARLPEGWTSLARPPFVHYSGVLVWIGTGLVLWGGDSQNDAVHHADGALWDPATDEWRVLPEAPISGRSQPAAVWTGRELLLWGGTAGSPLGDGAAFEPQTETWRTLAPSPLTPRIPAVAIWTGSELVVWGDRDRSAERADGAAYDPAADSWRTLPPAPESLNAASAVWTGTEVVVVGSWLDGRNRSATSTALALAYDPVADAWRRLPSPDLSPQDSSTALTKAGDVLAWDYELASTRWSAGEAWRPQADLPLDFTECYASSAPVGELILGWYCGQGAVYDGRDETWSPIPPRTGFVSGPVGVGPVALFAGPGLVAFRP